MVARTLGHNGAENGAITLIRGYGFVPFGGAVVFMLGLPIGIALSFLAGGYIAKSYGWHLAFFIAAFIGTIFIGMVIPIFSLQDHIK